MYNKPILYIIFNRLDYVKESMDILRKLKPAQLYIVSDGARSNKPGEDSVVKQVRKYVLENIDWECEIKTKFMYKNLGCGKNISNAITWFFKNESAGVILEDDCIPDMSFFRFMSEMLDKYHDNKNIWSVNGFTPSQENLNLDSDYFFQRRMHCWGWATWSDRWLNHFDYNISGFNKRKLKYISDLPKFKSELTGALRSLRSEKPMDTWAYRWAMNIVAGRGLCIAPAKNLVSNIGITGAHYENEDDNPDLNTQTYNLYKNVDLIHPKYVKLNRDIEQRIYNKNMQRFKLIKRIIKFIKNLFNKKKNIILNIYLVLVLSRQICMEFCV